MMKIGIAVLIVILICIGVYQFFSQPYIQEVPTKSEKILLASPKIEVPPLSILSMPSRYIFIPYWNPSIDKNTYEKYDRFIYFGITADETGTLVEDNGYVAIADFQNSTQGKEQLLTVRLLDSDINNKLLQDADAQKKLVKETIDVVNSHNFDGVVLDLEMSVLPLSEVQNNITLFVQRFSQAVHENNMTFSMTIYGDVYYRGRPYDIKQIGNYVDEILIMAYDFHKSRGEPGPNFPFNGRSTYGYDFEAMISDFSKDIPLKNLSVVMGMYGYDWILGPQGKPLKSAKALSLSDIRELAEPTCKLGQCKTKVNSETKESSITYIDEEGYNHEIWYENEASVEIKEKFLLKNGIDKIGYWVYGYF